MVLSKGEEGSVHGGGRWGCERGWGHNHSATPLAAARKMISFLDFSFSGS